MHRLIGQVHGHCSLRCIHGGDQNDGTYKHREDTRVEDSIDGLSDFIKSFTSELQTTVIDQIHCTVETWPENNVDDPRTSTGLLRLAEPWAARLGTWKARSACHGGLSK
jgi:hypothetical protein